MQYTDEERAEDVALLQEVLSGRKQRWTFQADHEDVEDLENLPTFPATRTTLPKTRIEEKLLLVDYLFEEGEEAEGPYSWIENQCTQWVVASVIVLNAILFGLETDIQSPIWVPLEHAILIFFTGEQIIRLARYGLSYFGSLGNWFDLLIVSMGAADLWFMPFAGWLMGQTDTKSSVLQAMQLLRLLRITRLIRIVRIIPPLYSLAVGIGEALQSMFWVLIFLFMMLYACAILTARCLGISPEELQSEGSEGSRAEEVRLMFHGVLTSMFVLFESITCWSLMTFVPLFDVSSISRVMAVIFYIFANWGLLAVMTGVVSEKMMATKERLTQETDDGPKHEHGSASMAHLEVMLVDFFKRADTDGSGSVSKDEFNSMLLCTDIMKPVMEESNLDAQDFGELFDWLDSDKDGCVNIDEFLRGFRWLVATVDPKGLLKLEEELSGDFHRLTKRMVDHVNHCFDQFLESVYVPLRKISAITEQIQRLDRLITTLLRCPEEMEGKIECASLDKVEARLTKKLETLAEAVQKLEDLEAQGLVKLVEQGRHSTMKSVSSDAEFTSETLQDPFAWRKMASGMLSEMPPLDDTNEDLIFFEPVVETLSDIANDDQEELPKGIGRSERAQMPNMGPVQRRSCLV